MFSKHTASHRKPARYGKRISVIGVALGAVVLAAGPAMAASAFQNGSFDAGSYDSTSPNFNTLTAGTPNAIDIDGWTVTQGSVDWIGTYWASQTGAHSVDMNGSPVASPDTVGAIAQTFTTVPGGTYAVQFYLAANPECGPTTKTVLVDTGGAQTPFSSDISVKTGQWTAEEYPFTADSSGTTTLTFSADPNNTSNCGAVVDSVTVTQILTSGAQCKDGGWQGIINPDTGLAYKNQGQCVSHFATSGATPIGS